MLPIDTGEVVYGCSKGENQTYIAKARITGADSFMLLRSRAMKFVLGDYTNRKQTNRLEIK